MISSRPRAWTGSTNSDLVENCDAAGHTGSVCSGDLYFPGQLDGIFWPLIVSTSPELYTLPVGLSSFAVEQSIQWEMIMTGAAIATLPTLIVFMLLQRYIVRGVMLAGLKG